MKNGRKNREPGLTYCIKFLMIEKKKSDSTWPKKNSINSKKSSIRKKYKDNDSNIKLNNKEKGNSNLREVKPNKKNSLKKSPQKNKEEEWSYKSYIVNNNKWKQVDNNMKEKFKIVKYKEGNNYKISKKLIDFIEEFFINRNKYYIFYNDWSINLQK